MNPLGIILIGLLWALYMLPTILAYSLSNKNLPAICLLNVLLGWTFIGWVVALIWVVKK
jgi:hypothetical protein